MSSQERRQDHAQNGEPTDERPQTDVIRDYEDDFVYYEVGSVDPQSGETETWIKADPDALPDVEPARNRQYGPGY